MALVNTDAIVLRSYNLAEADRIVVCLTRSVGLVRAVARGARRMKSRFGAALEPFTLVRLAFYEKENRELVTISTAEILKSQFDMAAELEAGEVLAYISEMVAAFAPPHEANERLFRMVVACVDALHASPKSGNAVLRYFEVWLLRLAGLFPDVRICAACACRAAGEMAVYLDSEAMIRCERCHGRSGLRLSPETQRVLMAIQQFSPLQFMTDFAPIKEPAESEVAELTDRLVVRALERRPRTMVVSSR